MENQFTLKRLKANPDLISEDVQALFYSKDGVFHSLYSCAPGVEPVEYPVAEIISKNICGCVLDEKLTGGSVNFGHAAFMFFSQLTLKKYEADPDLEVTLEDLIFLSTGPLCDYAAFSVKETSRLFGKLPCGDFGEYTDLHDKVYWPLLDRHDIRPAVEAYAFKAREGTLVKSFKKDGYPQHLIDAMVKALVDNHDPNEKILVRPDELDITLAGGRDPVADFFISERFFPSGEAKFLTVPLAIGQYLKELNWVEIYPGFMDSLTDAQVEVLNGLYDHPYRGLPSPSSAVYSSLEDALKAAVNLA